MCKNVSARYLAKEKNKRLRPFSVPTRLDLCRLGIRLIRAPAVRLLVQIMVELSCSCAHVFSVITKTSVPLASLLG